MSIENIKYKLINHSYYYVTINDNFNIIIDISTGFFNASKLCTFKNKVLKKWKKIKKNKKII